MDRSKAFATNSTSVAAIDRLPQEVFIFIFTILRDFTTSSSTRGLKETGTGGVWDWVALTHVCRSWRNTALHVPELWSHFHYFIDKQKTQTFLERSEDMELTVYARIPKTNSGYVDEEEVIGERSFHNVFECLKMVLKNIHRIRHLNLLVHYSSGATYEWYRMQDLLERPAPRLQELHFGGTPAMAKKSLYFPNFSNTSPLEILDLENSMVTLDIILLNLANMLELNLHNVAALRPLDFLAILKSCPKLEALRVRKVDWAINAGGDSLEDIEISLPKLAFLGLYFRGYHEKWDDEIFRRISGSDNMNWQCFYESEEFKSILDLETYGKLCKQDLYSEEVLMILDSSGVRILSQNFSNVADSEASTSSLNASSSDLELDWGYYKPKHLLFPYLESLISGCHWRKAQRLTLNLQPENGHVFKIQDWITLLLCLPSVKFIEIVVEQGARDRRNEGRKNGNILNFLKVLTHLCRSQIPEGTTVCPLVEHLSLEWDKDDGGKVAEILGKGLRNRKRMGLGLKKLTISESCLSDEDVYGLSELVELAWKDSECYRSQYYRALSKNPSFRQEREWE